MNLGCNVCRASRRRFLLAATAVMVMWLGDRSIRADVIYRETFGIPPGVSADATATVFDW